MSDIKKPDSLSVVSQHRLNYEHKMNWNNIQSFD